MRKIDTLNAHIKFGTNLFHLTWEKKRKFKTGHSFMKNYEEKGKFGVVKSDSLCFKWGTLTILGPKITKPTKPTCGQLVCN